MVYPRLTPRTYGHQSHDLFAKPRHQLGKDGAERRSAGRDEAPNRGEAPGRAIAPNSRRLSETVLAYERERSAPPNAGLWRDGRDRSV